MLVNLSIFQAHSQCYCNTQQWLWGYLWWVHLLENWLAFDAVTSCTRSDLNVTPHSQFNVQAWPEHIICKKQGHLSCSILVAYHVWKQFDHLDSFRVLCRGQKYAKNLTFMREKLLKFKQKQINISFVLTLVTPLAKTCYCKPKKLDFCETLEILCHLLQNLDFSLKLASVLCNTSFLF